MKELIHEYTRSCELVRIRIKELSANAAELKKNGDETAIETLNLEQRIKLLQTEHRQMQEIITHLTSYIRRALN